MKIQPIPIELQTVPCAFCKGKGRDPFNLLSPLSTCQACGGRGVHQIQAPVVPCAFCKGRGVQPFTRMTCTTCDGVGYVTVPEEAVTCPGCRGSGREADHEFHDSVLSCTRCGGKGVIPAKSRRFAPSR